MKKNNKKGFTLIELLAVIVILAILATAAYTLVIPRINEQKPKTFITDVSNVIDAAELYFNEKGTTNVTVSTLLSGGYLKVTGNTDVKGIVELKNNIYYISYTNGSYMTTANKMVNSQKITAPSTNMKSCSGTSGTDACAALTTVPSSQSAYIN